VAEKPSGPIARYEHLDEIESLAARFGDCSLPCVEWTHRAHLTVGLWTLREHLADEALRRIRAGIQRYNAACGVVTTPTRGYHETITCFYMRVIGHYLSTVANCTDWLAVTNGLLDQYGSPDLPFAYYTRERLMSPEARAAWVEPDLRVLADAGGARAIS
jgi:hypothetical protein